MNAEPTTLSTGLRLGAWRGLGVWAAYAAVSCLLFTIFPLLFQPEYVFTARQWRWLAFFLGLDLLAGLLLGALAGLACALWARRAGIAVQKLVRPAGTLTLILAFLVNLLCGFPWGKSEYAAFLVTLLLLYALAKCLRSPEWFEHVGFLAGPVTATLLLLSLPWINTGLLLDRPLLWKAGASLAAFVAILGGSWLFHRRFPASPTGRSGLALGLLALLFGSTLLFHRRIPLPTVSAHSSGPAAAGPNLVLIVLDTVRADHLSLYGYQRDTTPNLKKLAAEATLYTNAIAAADMTLASHASMFTGLYPTWHGAHYALPQFPGGRPLPEDIPTLAGILSAKGYRTAAVAANFAFLQPTYRLNRGFETFELPHPLPVVDPENQYYLRYSFHALLRHFIPMAEVDLLVCHAQEITQAAFALLDLFHAEDRPFFLFLNYMDAHSPYVPPSPFNTLFPGRDPLFTNDRYLRMSQQVCSLQRHMTEHERRHLESQYDGSIAYMDSQIGKLLAQLKRLGLYDNSLILITGDHGEAFGEKDLVQHGVSVYQNQVHVPLLIKYPHRSQAETVDRLVSQVDYLPTILQVLGYPAPPGIQGVSLLAPPAQPRYLISESFPSSGRFAWNRKRFDRTERAIFSGSMKFITANNGTREVYDLSRDPREDRNLFRPEDPAGQVLAVYLREWARAAPKRFVAGSQVGQQALQRLKSLGYVQ